MEEKKEETKYNFSVDDAADCERPIGQLFRAQPTEPAKPILFNGFNGVQEMKPLQFSR